MPSVQYGKKIIHFTFHEKRGLRSHYISVEQGKGVVLKGSRLPVGRAEKLILKKASWIVDKLQRVRAVKEDSIVSGSRISYLGKQYYAQVKVSKAVESAKVEFNYSSFRILVNPDVKIQPAIRKAIEVFYKEKALEKIAPRVEKLSVRTGLEYKKLKFVKMVKRWGSCTAENNIILNPEAMKLPFTLIDYLIVHELCHTKVKDHSRKFWREVSKHMANWRECDEKFRDWVY